MMRKYHEAKISPPKLNEKAHKNDISICRASNNKCHWNRLFFIRSVYAYDSYGYTDFFFFSKTCCTPYRIYEGEYISFNK